MVTKVNLKAFVLLTALLITALFVGGTFVYAVFMLLLLLLLVSYLSGKSANKNLVNIVWKNNDKIQAGSKLNLSLELYNSGIFPIPFLKVKTNLTKKLTGEDEKNHVYSVMSGEKLLIEREFLCKVKGVYKIGYIEVDFGDSLGVFSWKKIFESDVLLHVYPRVHELKSFAIPLRQHFGTVAVRHNAYEDFASIRDIRKYVSGDSYKKIHWKVTAHKGDFHVKNVDLNATAELSVFWDLYKNNYQTDHSYEMEELGAECAASILRFALSHNMSASFIAKGDSFTRVSGTGLNRFGDFLEAITRITADGDTPIWELIKHEGQKLNLGATAVIITSNASDLLLETLLSFKSRGIGFVLVYVTEDRSLMNSNIEALKQQDIKVFTIGLQDDIKQILGGQHAR